VSAISRTPTPSAKARNPASATGGSGGLAALVSQTVDIAGRHIRFFVRQPWFVLMAIIQPVIWLLLFGALFESATLIPGFGGGASYLDYLVPGVLVMTALFSCGWSGMSIVEDLEGSIIDRFLVTPIHRSAIIAGLNAYELVAFGIQAAIIGGLALLLGARFEGGILGFAALTLCAMLIGATVASLSDALALRLRQRESVIGINTLLTLPLTFLSAAFIPLALAPDWIRTVATYNPVNWAVEAGREALAASPDWAFVLPRIAALFALATLSAIWATRTFSAYQRSI
jgi:ABC-2 type transport system permease protein